MKAPVMKTLTMITILAISSHHSFAQAKIAADSTNVSKPITLKAPTNTPPDYLKVTPIQNNYYNSLGAACKAELNFEKSTKVPLRLRLGSLQQTDYMEQKPNAVKPGQ